MSSIMIKRIVKMTFREDSVPQFLDIFASSKNRIRAFPGCRHLELWRDQRDPRIFFTYSWWDHLEDLDAYRKSDLFASVWPRTKAIFAEKAEAWSTVTVDEPTEGPDLFPEG